MHEDNVEYEPGSVYGGRSVISEPSRGSAPMLQS